MLAMISQVANYIAALTGRADGDPRLAGPPGGPAALPAAAEYQRRNDLRHLTYKSFPSLSAALFEHACDAACLNAQGEDR